MNDKELKQARKQYQNNIKINKELEQLQKTKEVLRYLELTNLPQIIKTEEKILIDTFAPFANNTKDSNNIYVFMGSYYKYNDNTKEILLRKNDSQSNYNYYWDLETEKCIHVKKEQVEEFEKNNIILDNKVPTYSTSFKYYHENFYQIQSKYFKTLTYTTQEKAKEKIRKMSNLNRNPKK